MKLLTTARDLRRRKGRERQGLFAAEGIRAVEELALSSLDCLGVLLAPDGGSSARAAAAVERLRVRGAAVAEVTAAELESAADTDSPQGILAVARIPRRSLADLPRPSAAQRFLVLDAIQDPGNVGTMLRTAAAFGAVATLALPGTVDLWNAKVVRSAMGAHFEHPALHCTWTELDTFRGERALAIWAADAHGEPLEPATAPAATAIVVGNEGGGLSPDARRRAERLVALPIAPGVESLNVAVAAGILLYELRV